MNYCSQCGKAVEQIIPDGDNRHRFVCTVCEHVHYQNPRIIAGCLPIFENKVLLCKRAIEPRKGYWTLPAGFLENGEATSEGALRETIEEANARVEILDLYTVFSVPHISQVYMFFRANLPVAEFSAGVESLAVDLFDEADIPWNEISFPAIARTLEHYFEDRKQDQFPTRYAKIERTPLNTNPLNTK